jgi:ribulose-5-phosphate 4-epimerase/fuculose-1-phosphate aldolase
MNDTTARERLVSIGASLFARGLTGGSSGNLSVRTDDGILITPTNTSLGRIDPARLSVLSAAGEHLSGDRPSKEAFLHLAMYRVRTDDHAVVHLHATNAVAVSCLSDVDDDDVLPALTPYFVMRVGKVPRLPYFAPGDPAAEPAVLAAARRHRAVLLANHGPVLGAATPEAAADAIEELEETARLYLLTRGMPIRPLTAEQVAELAPRE